MVNPKELRIGNWIEVKRYENRNRRIEEIGSGLAYLCPTEFKDGSVESYIDIHPIPLTHKILLKIGFRYDTASEQYIKMHTGVSQGSQKVISLENDYDSEYFRFTLFDIPINSVHQLQNLFFALTGEELEIKL